MRAVWYFDVVSPFAYLHLRQFHHLPQDLDIEFVPVLFAGLLKAHGHKGPAEIAEKRRQTYRMCVWLAARDGIPLRFPPFHPFNPLKTLRLLVHAGPAHAHVESAFRAIWEHGGDMDDPAAFAALARELGVDDPMEAVNRAEVKDRLGANTARAIARGVYGVPTFDLGGELFWGADALGMMRDYAANPRLFAGGEFARVDTLEVSARRRTE